MRPKTFDEQQATICYKETTDKTEGFESFFFFFLVQFVSQEN